MQPEQPLARSSSLRSLFVHLPTWIVPGISSAGILAGLVVMVSSAASGRAVVNFGVAVVALVLSLLVTWIARAHLSWRLLILIAAIALLGLFSSLGVRDDYFGGTCGEFDWPSGHLHAGYPYSWLDGHICVPPQAALGEYVRQHPWEAIWYPDLPALVIDLLFWTNVGILVSSGLGLLVGVRGRLKHPVS